MDERLDLDDDRSIILLAAPSRRALSRMVRDRNPGHINTGCGRDCTGQVCGRYAELLRAYRVGRQWIGVVHVQIVLDI